MCLGVPAKLIAITDEAVGLALAETQGVTREVSLAMLALQGQPVTSLLGRWVLIHVGFAMALIDEDEAARTLTLLQDMENDGP
ncbi:HypC/HybG/HupF family hydrogenase formation chaperone [Alteromonas sp. CYL-A6]|uniref:HypC/HybG/HupF family hydrogenase formation chaperone n=1 Tax=Alteromonas nitratireducens TaxID=3390813 RepID=UPI0034AD56D1